MFDAYIIHYAKQRYACVHCFALLQETVTVPQLQGDGESHGHQEEHERAPHHEQLQQVQQQKPVATSHYETVTSVSQPCASITEHHGVQQKQTKLSSGQQEVVIPLDPNDPALKKQKMDYVNLPPEVLRRKPVTTSHYASAANVSQHHGSMTEHHHVHEQQLHKQKQQYKVSSGQQEVVITLNPHDPKTLDYVNLLPDVAYTVPPKSQGEMYLDQYRVPKPPKPSPRSTGVDTGRDTSPLPPSNTPKTTSIPERDSYTDENGALDNCKIGDDIRQEGAEINVATGRDERRFTLSEIPFDPFLDCLYCNQKFRYGEIQKYRKHVNTCAGNI